MQRRRDPVEAQEAEGEEEMDLYDIATWEPRTLLDRWSIRLYRGLGWAARGIVIIVAAAILIAQFALTGLAAVANPVVGTFILLSVVPALALAAYVWRVDVSMREPLGLLVITFLLGVLFASFAAVFNSLAEPSITGIPLVGMALFFFLVVGPVEETVKWLAIRLYAYRSASFDAVIDGAVYGAVAGLGFATIENTIYIGQQYLNAVQGGSMITPLGATIGTAAIRTFAGPGHVIYSGFAGYYLGLAKFNPDNAGPIVVKGLLIATLLHGTYNTAVTYLPGIAQVSGITASPAVVFLGFVIVYDGIFGFVLYRKLARYRKMYRRSRREDSLDRALIEDDR